MSQQPTGSNDAKQHLRQSGEVAYEAAIDNVIGRARNTLHIFDADLSRGGYSSPGRCEALRDFLRRDRSNRLVLVLHETDYLMVRCPRLMDLLKTHSHAIAIHKTVEHARVASDAFVVADEAHYVHRFHSAGADFLLALHEHTGAHQLEERFAALLEASYPAVFATTLGL